MLTAVAEDGGGLSCTASVLIYLKDVNDNPPVFRQGSLRESYSIREDAQIHTLLTRVLAEDADTGNFILLLHSPRNGKLMFFASDVVKMLRCSIVSS